MDILVLLCNINREQSKVKTKGQQKASSSQANFADWFGFFI